MTDNWTYTEKIFGSIILICGAYILYATIISIKSLFDYLSISVQNSGYSISIIKLIWSNQLAIIISLLSVFAGLALIMSKKIGWLISLAVLIYFTFMFSSYLMNTEKTGWSFDKTADFYIEFVFMILVSVSMSVVLVLKPFREKYNPSKLNWLTAFLIFGFLIADLQIINNKTDAQRKSIESKLK